MIDFPVSLDDRQVDLTLSLDEWDGLEQKRSAILQVDSFIALRLVHLSVNEGLSFDALLEDMLSCYLGAKFNGQVYPESRPDVPGLDS